MQMSWLKQEIQFLAARPYIQVELTHEESEHEEST
jgi:hypothetical protein